MNIRMNAVPLMHNAVRKLNFLNVRRRPIRQLDGTGRVVIRTARFRTAKICAHDDDTEGGYGETANEHRSQFHVCHSKSIVGNACRGKMPPVLAMYTSIALGSFSFSTFKLLRFASNTRMGYRFFSATIR